VRFPKAEGADRHAAKTVGRVLAASARWAAQGTDRPDPPVKASSYPVMAPGRQRSGMNP